MKKMLFAALILIVGCNSEITDDNVKTINLINGSCLVPRNKHAEKYLDVHLSMLPVKAKRIEYMGNNYYLYNLEIDSRECRFMAHFSYITKKIPLQ